MEQPGARQPRGEAASVASELSGLARDVLQARDITGGVHFHGRARAETVVPRQLPADVRGFVGRESELNRLHAAMQLEPAGPTAVMVLVGTAGVGKSALALRFAHQVRERFDGGQLFVNLRGYDTVRPVDPATVLGRFLHAFGIPPPEVPPELEERSEQYRSLLADRRVLVVLDNAATVGQVRPLLPGGSGCLVVVTSRSRLSGLAARDGALRVSVGLLPESEAVALLEGTTAGYRGGDDPAALAELARLCARLPLALRIAGERAAARPLMPLATLIAELRGESSLWQALSAEDETEADAVRTVFAWSYRALPEAAARAFRLLGLFPGPHFSVECAAALLDVPVERAAGLLDVLAGAHLIEQRSPTRYQFHDLLRAFAADQARQNDDGAQLRGALARTVRWYLHTAHAAGQAIETLRPGVVDEAGDAAATVPGEIAGPRDAAAWYQAEQTNLPPIVHAAGEAGLDREAWQLAVTLGPLHATAGSLAEWLDVADVGLEAARHLGDRTGEAHVQMTRATALTLTRRPAAAADALRAARLIFAETGDLPGTIDAGNRLGLVHRADRRLEPARACFREVLRAAGEAGLTTWQALALENLADTAEAGGEHDEAVGLAEQALARFGQAGAEPHMTIGPRLVLARVRRKAGRLDEASVHLAEAAAILAEGIANRWLDFAITFERGAQLLVAEQYEQALEGYWRCAGLARSLGDRQRETRALTAIGLALVRLGRAGEAEDFARTAAALAREHATAYDAATALSVLAQALSAGGQGDEALRVRAEAAALLEAYTDPAANDLRADLDADT